MGEAVQLGFDKVSSFTRASEARLGLAYGTFLLLFRGLQSWMPLSPAPY